MDHARCDSCALKSSRLDWLAGSGQRSCRAHLQQGAGQAVRMANAVMRTRYSHTVPGSPSMGRPCAGGGPGGWQGKMLTRSGEARYATQIQCKQQPGMFKAELLQRGGRSCGEPAGSRS